MKYAQVIAEQVGKLFASKEEAVAFHDGDKEIFPVVYPSEWAEMKNKKREDMETFIMIDGEYQKCFIIGVDVSYPQE